MILFSIFEKERIPLFPFAFCLLPLILCNMMDYIHGYYAVLIILSCVQESLLRTQVSPSVIPTQFQEACQIASHFISSSLTRAGGWGFLPLKWPLTDAYSGAKASARTSRAESEFDRSLYVNSLITGSKRANSLKKIRMTERWATWARELTRPPGSIAVTVILLNCGF